jgi:hypothetical protein
VKLGLEFPCSENRSEEGDKRLYRLELVTKDEARAARSALSPGRLFFGSVSFGEAMNPLARRNAHQKHRAVGTENHYNL